MWSTPPVWTSKCGAQVLHRHYRALQVPARGAPAPRGAPLHLAALAGRQGPPDGEVARVAFAFGHFDPGPGALTGQVQAGQVAVAGVPGRVEVQAGGQLVAPPGPVQKLGEGDHLGYVVGGLAPHLGLE